MRVRSKAREIALCVLYELEVSGKGFRELLDNYFKNYPRKEEAREFSSQLAKGVTDNLAELNSIIKKYARNWELSRMAVIDRNILRMATFELLFLGDIPPKVSINEAVELAKKFGDVDSPRFVNGILDKIYKVESTKNS